MLVKNESPVELHITKRGVLEPGAFFDYLEATFNTLDINSEIGNCVILTVYGKRHIKNYGSLIAFEGEKKDKHGMKEIIIQAN